VVAVVHVGVREVFRPAARVAHLWPGLGIPAEARLPAAGCVRASLAPCRACACICGTHAPTHASRDSAGSADRVHAKVRGLTFISSQPIKSFGPRRKERLKEARPIV